MVMVAESSKTWDQLIKPYKMAFELQKGEDRVGTLTVEPLEHGFGVTLGNALRRVLLSSIKGSAITSVRIEGVLLEFSSIPGVTEDVLDILLNLKSLDVDLLEEGPRTYKLHVKGPCVVTASMIESDALLRILNPDHIICTLAEDASISMELSIEKGRGYVPVSARPTSMSPVIGEMFLDAQFNPIRRVSYAVENTRVGQSTEYDRLTLTVETNGALTAEEAISRAASILQEQLSRFVSFNLETYDEDKASAEVEPAENMAFPPIYFRNVKDLDLGVRCLNCLQNEGIAYVGDLIQKKESDLMRTPNFGRKSLRDIHDVLTKFGLSLGMEVPGWNSDLVERHLRDFVGKEI